MEFSEVQFDLPSLLDQEQFDDNLTNAKRSAQQRRPLRSAKTAPASVGGSRINNSASRNHNNQFATRVGPKSQRIGGRTGTGSASASGRRVSRKNKKPNPNQNHNIVVDDAFIAETRSLVEQFTNGAPPSSPSLSISSSTTVAGPSVSSRHTTAPMSMSHQSKLRPVRGGKNTNASAKSLKRLEEEAMVRSAVPRLYKQRVERQPLPSRMDGNLKPLGYNVLDDVGIEHPSAM